MFSLQVIWKFILDNVRKIIIIVIRILQTKLIYIEFISLGGCALVGDVYSMIIRMYVGNTGVCES